MPATTSSSAVTHACADLGNELDFSVLIEEVRRRAVAGLGTAKVA
jgi:hypothetical protein